MKILDRYLAAAVIGGTALTMAVLLPLLGFFILADEMDAVGEDGYRLLDALAVVALSLPRYAYQLAPIATLIGALVGLGALAGRSELVAMRAAGVSIARIVAAALKAGLLLALLALALGEGLAPEAEQRAARLRAEAQAGQVTLATPYGFWARDGRSYINIVEILPGAKLKGIYVFELDAEQRLRLAAYAPSAQFEDGSWVFPEVYRSQIGPDGVQTSTLVRSRWDSLLDPGLLELVVVEPHVLPVWGLLRYVRYLEANGQDPGAYEVALWGKVVHPFLVLAMIFLSLPILFASARSRGIGVRMLLGVMVGIAFYLVSRSFSYFALLYEMNAVVAALAPPLIFVVAAFWVLRRVG